MQDEVTTGISRSRRGGFFDFDGTVSRWHSMHSYDRALVADGLSPHTVGSKVDEFLLAYRNRQASFIPFVSELVRQFQERLRGLKVVDALRVALQMTERRWQNVYVFTRELILASRELDIPCFLISGGPKQVLVPFAERLGFTDVLASDYPHVDGVYTGEKPAEWIDRKDEAVRLLADMHGIDLASSFAVGDTQGDEKMLRVVKYPICFNPNRALLDLADTLSWPVVIERKDVILPLICDGRAVREVGRIDRTLPEPLASTFVARLRRLGYL